VTATATRVGGRPPRARTYGSMTASAALHALLFLWLVTHRTAAASRPEITEITLLGPEGPAAAAGAPAPAPRGPDVASGVAARAPRSVHFERKAPRSDVAPDPQTEWAAGDRLDARLASLQRSDSPSAAGVATTAIPTSLFGAAAPAAAGGVGGGGAAIALTRAGGGGGGGGIELARGGSIGGGSVAVPAIPEVRGTPGANAPAVAGESTARRTIAGASILGPIADRPVLAYQVPDYPEWAKKDAVEASVTLYFVVRPDGGVKENVLVQKTAGFEDFDDSARAALRVWQFEPLRAGRTGEQWGIITFHFRLRDVG